MKRKTFTWHCRNKKLLLGERTLIMGILNSTPDSFSDGGQFYSLEKALEHSLKMAEDGADIIDIGGESTRPGSERVNLNEELKRTIPLIQALRAKNTVAISIDTTKAEVAKQALLAGANIINDVSGFQLDPEMANVAKALDAGCAVMHMRGTPDNMQNLCKYKDLIDDVKDELNQSMTQLLDLGLNKNQLVLDPGIGFSKTAEQNIEIMKRLSDFHSLGYPMLLGTSRKSFIGHILDETDAQERVWGTAASLCVGIQHGAHIMRVHDVKQMAQVCKVYDFCS
ncbi:dihydropteroate synthase [Lentisphaera profundi]|uniref:Dihydropteroate synthase n=1 Tax=Lentisphaera profundi TaxID=1658616 RepID=A0ABY7VX31_9BACT|nr:dihydropteroate synthase [Lentisphaera profundi]WDE97437.1 dihydropteroate synthase [Lentisphaera profundi]